MANGAFITFEGCDGVGKSTQVALLKEYLEKTNQDALFTREPGGTALAEKIRGILMDETVKMTALAEAYLFAAARAEHMKAVILPALEEGKIVVCDRFIDSSYAYQGAARGLGQEVVADINKYALFGRLPDCTVFIDMNPLNSWRKQKGKTVEDRIEIESAEFHLGVYGGFRKLAKESGRFVSIVPEQEKADTARLILNALRARNLIK